MPHGEFSDPGEAQAFRLGQAASYDYLLQRLGELTQNLRQARTALVLPRRRPEGGAAVTKYDTSKPCDRPDRKDRIGPPDTCMQLLASGWIGVMDFCPGCTVRLQAGLEWISPEPLRWHSGYTERAEQGA